MSISPTGISSYHWSSTRCKVFPHSPEGCILGVPFTLQALHEAPFRRSPWSEVSLSFLIKHLNVNKWNCLFVCAKCCAKKGCPVELQFCSLFSYSNLRSLNGWRHFRARVLMASAIVLKQVNRAVRRQERCSSTSVEEKGSHSSWCVFRGNEAGSLFQCYWSLFVKWSDICWPLLIYIRAGLGLYL